VIARRASIQNKQNKLARLNPFAVVEPEPAGTQKRIELSVDDFAKQAKNTA
jgi:hypothetical protein